LPTVIGRVRSIFRYPVKSMAGVSLEHAHLGWHGIDGDRRFAFRRVSETGGMPWLTASRLPKLVLYRPHGCAPEDASLPTHVRTPDGRELPLRGDELRTEIVSACGAEVELMRLRHGIFDETPVSILTAATLDTVAREAGRTVDVRRFRPNFFLETSDAGGLPEDAWVGKVLHLGSGPDAPAVAVTMRDERCAVINFDPDTAASDAAVMKAAVRLNGNRLGVYAVVVRTGTVTREAEVCLEG
jgi:uncharacterized protein YcbX